MFHPPKLYVMAKPTPSARRHACGLRSASGLDDAYDPLRLHCTMLRLGSELDWRPDALTRLLTALDAVRFDPFAVAFDQLEGRMLRGTKGSAAADFHRTLRRHAARCDVSLPDHAFWLHMSLAYQGPALAGIRKLDPVIGWTIDEFLLVRSGHGRHDLLGCWRLGSQGSFPF